VQASSRNSLRLAVLLQQRRDHPFRDHWALPGGFVGVEESLDAAARRVLATKAGVEDAYVEQLHAFGAPDREPRMRIITIAFFALLHAQKLAAALDRRSDLRIAALDVPWRGDAGGLVAAAGRNGEALPLAFDHAEILGHAVKRLRGKLDDSPIAFALLPPLFTLRDLQAIHEAILGATLNKPAFRRRMLDTGRIRGTGEKESGASYRPAELYRFEPRDGEA
jgi:8-oxo-dGTP diphosphatase